MDETQEALIRELKDKLEKHEQFAWLCLMDYCFWGYDDRAESKPTPCLLLNDVFTAGADARQLTWDEVTEIYHIAKNGTWEDVLDWERSHYEDGED